MHSIIIINTVMHQIKNSKYNATISNNHLAWFTSSAYNGSGILRTSNTVKAIISFASRGGKDRRILFGLFLLSVSS